MIFLLPGQLVRDDSDGGNRWVSEPPAKRKHAHKQEGWRRDARVGRGVRCLINGLTRDRFTFQGENAALTFRQQTQRLKSSAFACVHTAERVPKLTWDFLFWELTGLSHCGVTQALSQLHCGGNGGVLPSEEQATPALPCWVLYRR